MGTATHRRNRRACALRFPRLPQLTPLERILVRRYSCDMQVRLANLRCCVAHAPRMTLSNLVMGLLQRSTLLGAEVPEQLHKLLRQNYNGCSKLPVTAARKSTTREVGSEASVEVRSVG